MVKKQKAYRRAQRKQQVIEQLTIWLQNDYAQQATSYKLAKALGMNASPHFNSILLEMVGDGILEMTVTDQPGRWATRMYKLNVAYYREKFSPRTISVQKRGVAVGQLELFS